MFKYWPSFWPIYCWIRSSLDRLLRWFWPNRTETIPFFQDRFPWLRFLRWKCLDISVEIEHINGSVIPTSSVSVDWMETGVCGSGGGSNVISCSCWSCCDERWIAVSVIKPFPKSSGAFTTSNREVCCCLVGSCVNDDSSVSPRRHGGGSRFIGIMWPKLLLMNDILRALFKFGLVPTLSYLDWISSCRCAAIFKRRSCPMCRFTSSISSPRWIDPRRTMCPVWTDY